MGRTVGIEPTTSNRKVRALPIELCPQICEANDRSVSVRLHSKLLKIKRMQGCGGSAMTTHFLYPEVGNMQVKAKVKEARNLANSGPLS